MLITNKPADVVNKICIIALNSNLIAAQTVRYIHGCYKDGLDDTKDVEELLGNLFSSEDNNLLCRDNKHANP